MPDDPKRPASDRLNPDRPNLDRPGFNDLVTPFIFVPHGAPDPVAWKKANPGWVSFPATFIPHKKPGRRYAVINGRRWPLDKRGQPWPRSRFGQPLCPLDEFPPGVPAPGTQGKLIAEQQAALQDTVARVRSGELTPEWFTAERLRGEAERAAHRAANPSPPLPAWAGTYDPMAPARAYLAERAGETPALAMWGAAASGFDFAREYQATKAGMDAYTHAYAEGARQRNAMRSAASAPASLDGSRQPPAEAGSVAAAQAPDAAEQASPDAPGAAGVGPVLSDSDGPATHLPNGTPLLRVADRRTHYGPNSTFWPNSPANQALVRDTERAAKALGNGPGYTPMPPLPPSAPLLITPSQPRAEGLPADEAASRPRVLSTPQAPALPTVTAGDEFDSAQVTIMEASRNSGLDPELRTYAARARHLLSEDWSIWRAGLAAGEWRAHHLIPHEVVRRNVELFQAAARAGYLFDNSGNLVALPTTPEAQKSLDKIGERRPIHDNPHRGWNATRLLEVREISDELARLEYPVGSVDYNFRAKLLLEGWQHRLRVLLPAQRRLTQHQSNGTDTESIG